jgi:hypothetical protein
MRNEKPLYVRTEPGDRESFDELVGDACGTMRKKVHAADVFRASIKYAMEHKASFFSFLRKELDGKR